MTELVRVEVVDPVLRAKLAEERRRRLGIHWSNGGDFVNPFVLEPGQKLWYRNRFSGEIESVEVVQASRDEFTILYQRKKYRLPILTLGTRLYRTRKIAEESSKISIRLKPHTPKREKTLEEIREDEWMEHYIDSLDSFEYEPVDDDRDYWRDNFYNYSHDFD